MTQITLDAYVASALHKVHQEVELCDPTGRVLGRFVPTIDMSQWVPVTPDISEEELDRRQNSNKWHTTEQVLEHLKKLESQ
ncbi:MAG: hypothetical protein K2R98_25440 [Gemmataceae bacterium]|nr:hypothetical protein [Gemmataceae bacterium]